MHGRWFVSLVLLFSLHVFATPNIPLLHEQKVVYRDTAGIDWTRHIMTERRKDNRTLLLVIDVPVDTTYRQRVIFRRSYAVSEFGHLEKAKLSATNVLQTMATQVPNRVSTRSVWDSDRSWTAADEADYAKWLQQNAAENFLEGSGVSVDCADYGITLRWIYAHDHKLPVGDQLAASGVLVGSWGSSADWDNLPTDPDWRKDERFKAALRYVLDNTFTHSLFTDLYPVTITTEYVKPGTIFLTLVDDSGHTRTIFNIGTTGACDNGEVCISIIWGNEPASEEGFISTLIPWHLDSTEGGFLRFRWPIQVGGVWQLTDPKQMPGYSTEQYDWTPVQYLANISQRLNIWTTPEARYVTAGQVAAGDIAARAIVTSIGYFLCSIVQCSASDPLYVQWSTPVRDKTLQDEISAVQIQADQIDPNNETVLSFQNKVNVPLFDGSSLTVLDILSGNYASSFASDPTVDIFARWNFSDQSEQQNLLMLADAAFINFQYRESFVRQAQALCFPSGGVTPSCNATDPAVNKFATDRLDQAFRSFQTTFQQSFQAASVDDQSAVAAVLQQRVTIAPYCPNAPKGQFCSMYDFLILSPQHLAVMKSNVDAPFASRFGF